MRRLTSTLRRRAVQRAVTLRTDEEGATAVIVAMLLVVLLGFGALTIDVGAMYAERRELQNGADAAALAVAQDCATGDCNGDGSYGATREDTADAFADDNANDLAAAVDEVRVPGDYGTNTVTVDVASDPAVPLRFAPVFGMSEKTVHAAATAAWGNVGGAPTLPITFSACEWNQVTGGGSTFADPDNIPSSGETFLIFHKDTSGCSEFKTSSGADLPGGFGWLADEGAPEDAGCGVYVESGPDEPAKVGRSIPKDCSVADFDSYLGTIVLIPIFDDLEESGSNGSYDIWGFGAFYLTSYAFNGTKTNTLSGYTDCRSLAGINASGDCLSGFFTQFVAIGGTLSPGGPALGGSTVALID